MKIRLYQLAKKLKIESQTLIDVAQEIGLDITSHMNLISEGEAEKILMALPAYKDSKKKAKKKKAKKEKPETKKKTVKKKTTKKKVAKKKTTTKKKAAKKQPKKAVKKKSKVQKKGPSKSAKMKTEAVPIEETAIPETEKKIQGEEKPAQEKTPQKTVVEKEPPKEEISGKTETASPETETSAAPPEAKKPPEKKPVEGEPKKIDKQITGKAKVGKISLKEKHIKKYFTTEKEDLKPKGRRKKRYYAKPTFLEDERAVRPKETKKKEAEPRTKGKSEGVVTKKERGKKAPVKPTKVSVELPVTAKELSPVIGVKVNEIIKKLMGFGVMANINQAIDEETLQLLGMEFGVEINTKKTLDVEEEFLVNLQKQDREEDLKDRAPIVTFLGHVDHGKTTLLDAIRKSNVATQEAGGITQHVGAYKVETDNIQVVFLDTPGHEAFTEMRSRGANVTDLVVLVVAADDGVMPQTIEAIDHAKAAEVPMVVAINKIDKPNANPMRVKQQLSQYDLIPEEWGGKTAFVEVSGLKGVNLDELVEILALEAELLELKANPNKEALGTVVEARRTEGLGVVATVLVQEGTLNKGDIFVCGMVYGRVRSLYDYKGEPIKSAGPSTPVEVTGFDQPPIAGDRFAVVDSLQKAREVAETRRLRHKLHATAPRQHVTLENLFNKLEEGKVKELNVIVKADVQGSVEVLNKSLNEISAVEVKVRILHSGVGGINESDVLLADASDAIIIGFNVVAEERARSLAHQKGVDIRLYQVIYKLTEDIKKALEGLLEPEQREEVIGHATVKEVFKTSKGVIAGCYVNDGKIARNGLVRIIRDNIVVYNGKIESLRRFKDDVREVSSGFECGLKIEKYDDLKINDTIESYVVKQIMRKLE